jgi:hypothetical protein
MVRLQFQLIVLRLWYKSLPEGTKAKTMRDAINLYRSQQNQQTGDRR